MKAKISACAAAAAWLCCASPAQAFQFDLGGGFNGAFDSTISYGAQMRMQGRSCALIGADNGGCTPATAELPQGSQDAFFLNTDDGDLNYNKHDLVSSVWKGTNELLLKMPYDLNFFGRVSYLYDTRIGETERTKLAPDARRFSVYNFQALDAYLNWNFDWLGHAAHLRAGNQVISWGEDIFVLGGINSVNAYDVRRYHVAGAQVKEILRPAPMVSINSDLVEGLSTEVYWQWKWNSFQLDPVGTYFSSADIAGKGYDGAVFIPTSSINAALMANPATATLITLGLIQQAPPGTIGDPGGTGLTTAQLEAGQTNTACLLSPGPIQQRLINGFTKPKTPGSALVARGLVCTALSSGTAIPLVSDAGGRNQGQYGISFRYHPEWVDADFGFYYEHFNAKIPEISYLVDQQYSSNNPVSAAYRIDYPSKRQLYGISYNTNVSDWALGGEVSWRPNDAVAIDPSVPTPGEPYACFPAQSTLPVGGSPPAHKDCPGWVDQAKFQAHQTFLQIFSPTTGLGGFVLPTLGAKEGYFLLEASATDYPGLSRLGRHIPWSLPAYTLPNKFSAGYTLESQVTYPNVMNLGFDWLPQIDWSHGVIGNTPNALPWQANVKAATFTLNFNRHNIITGALAYSWFFGGGPKNQTSDRDYLSFTTAYNF